MLQVVTRFYLHSTWHRVNILSIPSHCRHYAASAPSSASSTPVATLSAFELKQRYNLLHSASTPSKLHSVWNRLHAPYGRPLFSECCKMMQMLSSMKQFAELRRIYGQVLDGMSRSELAMDINAETVYQMMRCSKMAADWKTMNQFMRIHIENEWPFHKMSAHLAMECILNFDAMESAEDTQSTILKIWRNLMTHDVPNERCFIQFVLCLKYKFVDVDMVRLAMEELMGDIKRCLMMNGQKPLFVVIWSEMLECSERHCLDDIALRIMDEMPSSQSIWCSMPNDNRYKHIPLRFLMKMISFYDRHQTVYIERIYDLFIALKRLRASALERVDVDHKIWENELWNEQSLPILVKIYYRYFYEMALCGETIPSKALLTRYRDEAEAICKFINFSISTPMASLYLIAMDYLMENTEAANVAMMSLLERDFVTKNHLLSQWTNGQFVLNLLPKGLHQIPDVAFVPLIVSTLLFYAKHIPERTVPRNENLKSIKIKLDGDQWTQFQTLFEFMSEHFPPRIEYRIIGKIPDTVLVVELELHSLLKWSELHHIQREHILTQTVRDLIPKIFGDRQRAESTKYLEIIKDSIASHRGSTEKSLTE